MSLAILPVLFHRVGLILSLVPAVILTILPSIYTQEDDQKFTSRLSSLLIVVVRLGLALLIITGIIRLLSGIPFGFIIKLISALITIYWSTRLPTYPAPTYQQSHIIMVLLICLTAAVGIWL